MAGNVASPVGDRWKLAAKNVGSAALGMGAAPVAPPAEPELPFSLEKITGWFFKANPFFSHAIFLLVWIAWLLNSRDSDMSYAFSQLLKERILGSELLPSEDQVATTFHDVSSLDNVRQFMRGPFLDGLFGEQISGASGRFDVGWVNEQARMVGAVRIQQIRAATNSCQVYMLRVLQPTCYPSLSDGKRRVAPIYGEDLGGGLRRVYRYVAPKLTDLPFVAVYGGYMPGGFVVNVPARKLHAAAVMQQMDRDGFLAMSETRAMIVDFSLYNANINCFCIVRLTFEHPSTGGIKPFATFRTARLLPYESDSGQAQQLLDFLVITYVALLLFHRLRALRVARLATLEDGKKFSLSSYFAQKWILLDWLVIILSWMVISTKFYVRRVMNELAEQAPLDPDKHYPLFDVAQAAQVETNVLAIVSLLLFAKVFKFISHLPLIQRLLAAVQSGYTELLAFLLIFVTNMFAFTMAFHLAFGSVSADFKGVGTSFMSLLRFALGDVDLESILQMSPILGSVLALLFTFLVYLILIGIGVSVLLRAYAKQPAERERAELVIQAVIDRRDRLMASGRDDLRQMQRTLRILLKRASAAGMEKLTGSKARADRRRRVAKLKSGDGTFSFNKVVAAAAEAAAQRSNPGATDGGWIAAEPVGLLADDPMRDAERAFRAVADDAENRAITKEQHLIDVLKTMYLHAVDEHHEQLSHVEQVAAATRALRDENFAIKHALKSKGVALGPILDPPPPPKETALSAEELLASHAASKAGLSCGRRRGSTMAAITPGEPAASEGPPPVGVASAAALLSLTKHAKGDKGTKAGKFLPDWAG